MKDLAHHLKQLNRRVLRSARREEHEEEQWEEDMPYFMPAKPAGKKGVPTTRPRKVKADEVPSPYAKKKSVKEIRKQVKRKVRKTRTKRAATPKTPEEKNRLMKKRVPVFDRKNDAKPKKGARTSKKKRPRI